MLRKPDDEAVNIATVYAWLGDTDRALEFLTRANANRDWLVYSVAGEPLLASKLRGHPRYPEFARLVESEWR